MTWGRVREISNEWLALSVVAMVTSELSLQVHTSKINDVGNHNLGQSSERHTVV